MSTGFLRRAPKPEGPAKPSAEIIFLDEWRRAHALPPFRRPALLEEERPAPWIAPQEAN